MNDLEDEETYVLKRIEKKKRDLDEDLKKLDELEKELGIIRGRIYT